MKSEHSANIAAAFMLGVQNVLSPRFFQAFFGTKNQNWSAFNVDQNQAFKGMTSVRFDDVNHAAHETALKTL